MNIFYLDQDPRIAAKFHCDKHVIKMILESAQLLSTAHHVLDGSEAPSDLYKMTHKNHPSAIWVRESKENYMWLYSLMLELNMEYRKRYGHDYDHKTIDRLGLVLAKPPKNIPTGPFTPPPQCMPSEFQVEGDCIQAYQNYYDAAKRDIARWDYSETPYWF